MIQIDQFYPIEIIKLDPDASEPDTILYKLKNKYYKITKSNTDYKFNLYPYDTTDKNMNSMDLIIKNNSSTQIPYEIPKKYEPPPMNILNLEDFNGTSPSPEPDITPILKPIARKFKPSNGGKTKHKKRGFSRRKKIKTRKHKKR